MKKRKFRYADGGDVPPGGRFEGDVYERARRFVEDQERRAGEGKALDESEAPAPRRAAPKPVASAPAAPVAPVRRPAVSSGRAEIPVDTSLKAPASTGDMPGETERNIRNIISAAGPGAAMRAAPAVGRGIGALASSAREGWREGEKIKEVARATERGAKSRADIQAKRAMRQQEESAQSARNAASAAREAKQRPAAERLRESGTEAATKEVQGALKKGLETRRGLGRSKALEEGKPILQARKDTKSSRAARTRRTEEDMGVEFSRGGSASSRADGCAQRGKTRGKVY